MGVESILVQLGLFCVTPESNEEVRVMRKWRSKRLEICSGCVGFLAIFSSLFQTLNPFGEWKSIIFKGELL